MMASNWRFIVYHARQGVGIIGSWQSVAREMAVGSWHSEVKEYGMADGVTWH